MLTALLLTATQMPVAYTARYYYSASDKRVSHYQVYLSTLDGAKRRQITDGNEDCSGVSWQGSSAIVWIQGTKTYMLIRLDLKSGKKSILAKDPFIYRENGIPGEVDRGRAVYHIGKDRVVEVEGNHLKPSSVKTWTGNVPAFTLSSTDETHPGQLVYDPKTRVATVTMGDTSNDIASDERNEALEAAYVAADGSTYVVTFSGNSTFHGAHTVRRLSWATHEIFSVASGFDVDFKPGNRYAGVVTQRSLTPYGKGQVWVSQALIVNTQTGKEKSIAPKMVDATSISLRPGI